MGEMIESEEVIYMSSFPKHGCGFQDIWISGQVRARFEPGFPRFAQVSQRALWKAGKLCEQRVTSRRWQALQKDLSSTDEDFLPFSGGWRSGRKWRRFEGKTLRSDFLKYFGCFGVLGTRRKDLEGQTVAGAAWGLERRGQDAATETQL